MKKHVKLLSILLALVIFLGSCGGITPQDTEITTDPSTESTEAASEQNSESASEENSAEASEDTTKTPTEETTEQAAEEDTETESDETTEKESEETSEIVTEETTEKASEETSEDLPEETLETVPEDEQINFSIDDCSITKEDLLAMYTLTEADYESAIALLNEFLNAGLYGSSFEAADAKYQPFEDAFYHIQTQSSIATIIYYCDTADETAASNHEYADQTIRHLQNEYVTVCKQLYYESPYKDELFADWTEEDIQEMLDYSPEANEIRDLIDEISIKADNLSDLERYEGIPALYVELIEKNQQLAALYGYDNYYDYAAEKVYGRDYTREDIAAFREYFIEYIVPKKRTVLTNYSIPYISMSSEDKAAVESFISANFDSYTRQNYLIDYVNNTPGGIGDAMRHMFNNKNVVFPTSDHAHHSAFQIYLPEYETPFCLFGKSKNASTLAHEMGHYYAALTNPDLTSLDLMETHSQANEYLFLSYMKSELPANVYNTIVAYEMYLCYYNLTLCLIIDEFEEIVYSLESVEGYTAEDFDAIIAEICEQYGGIDAINSVVDINDYWRSIVISSPVYYISYAVSLTEALNIYALARESITEAHRVYKYIVEDAIPEDAFLITLEKAGLTSPFEEETMKNLVEIMTKKAVK